jgi:hypothetical protein
MTSTTDTLRSCRISNAASFSTDVPANFAAEFQQQIKETETALHKTVLAAKQAELAAVTAKVAELTNPESYLLAIRTFGNRISFPDISNDIAMKWSSLILDEIMDICAVAQLQIDDEEKRRIDKLKKQEAADAKLASLTVQEQIKLAVQAELSKRTPARPRASSTHSKSENARGRLENNGHAPTARGKDSKGRGRGRGRN